jgi:predicted nucleotidyltransferase
MPDALARALAVLQRRLPGAPTVYAFGSAVRGEEHAESDLDLAVLAAHPLAPAERFALQEAAAAAAGRDVDLVDLRAASTVMQAQVVSTGRVVLDPDPTAWAFWETMVYSAYALLNEERAGILADIAARGTVYAHG